MCLNLIFGFLGSGKTTLVRRNPCQRGVGERNAVPALNPEGEILLSERCDIDVERLFGGPASRVITVDTEPTLIQCALGRLKISPTEARSRSNVVFIGPDMERTAILRRFPAFGAETVVTRGATG